MAEEMQKKEGVAVGIVPPQDLSKTNTTEPKKIKPTASLYVKVIGLCLGGIVLFAIGVMLFQPHAYLWVIGKKSTASRQVTTTNVVIDRSVVDNRPLDENTTSQSFKDTVRVVTDTSYITPDTWKFKTVIHAEGGPEGGEGIEVLIFGDEAFQRQAGAETEYTPYAFEEGEYDSTVEAIQSSSFFQPGILPFAKDARIVWSTDGHPWWQPHYQFTVDVSELEAASPEWFTPELYPFGTEASLGPQNIEFVVDVWIHPFTGRVMHEVWNIKKANLPGDVYDIALKVMMERTFQFPSELTIDRPS